MYYREYGRLQFMHEREFDVSGLSSFGQYVFLMICRPSKFYCFPNNLGLKFKIATSVLHHFKM